MKPFKHPQHCPTCQSQQLYATHIRCEVCQTEISGKFYFSTLSRLSHEEIKFIIDFVKKSGSLKLMAQTVGVSYPTMRNRLDELIEKLEKITHGEPLLSPQEIGQKLLKEEISLDDAIENLINLKNSYQHP